MEDTGYLEAFLDCLSHSHYADMGDRCQLSCQRPHHSLHPPPRPANHPLLLLKMQHTWITPQLSKLPGPNLIKQLGHLANNQSSLKDKRANGYSYMAMQNEKKKWVQIMSPGKKCCFFLTIWLCDADVSTENGYRTGYKDCHIWSKYELIFFTDFFQTTFLIFLK